MSAPEIETLTTTTWYVYAGFFAFVLAMLFVDLRLFHAEEKEPSLKVSGAWVAVWIALGLGFGLLVLLWRGTTSGQEYFAGYLIEYSLSVDNMFVFVVIFRYFRVPDRFQHRVLFFGILGAIVFRTIFIVAGVALIRSFEWVIYIFGAFLLFTAYRIAKGIDETHPEDNPILKFVQKRLRATSQYHGLKLFVVENSKRIATPLFVVLVFIEVTDFLFALDSIPAVIAVSRDPFVILTSNVFAIVGLRALYFLLAGAMSRFHLLHYGLSFILAFVGSKMLLEAIDFEIPILVSLATIVVTLVITGVMSLLISPKPPPSSAVSETPESLS